MSDYSLVDISLVTLPKDDNGKTRIRLKGALTVDMSSVRFPGMQHVRYYMGEFVCEDGTKLTGVDLIYLDGCEDKTIRFSFDWMPEEQRRKERGCWNREKYAEVIATAERLEAECKARDNDD